MGPREREERWGKKKWFGFAERVELRELDGGVIVKLLVGGDESARDIEEGAPLGSDCQCQQPAASSQQPGSQPHVRTLISSTPTQ